MLWWQGKAGVKRERVKTGHGCRMTSLWGVSTWFEALKHVSSGHGSSERWGTGEAYTREGKIGGFVYQSSLTTASRVSHTAFSGTSTWHRDPGNLQGTGTEY